MQRRCKPPVFEEHDWSQFDFSRWKLDPVARDAATSALAGLADRLFDSEEWRESVKATLPEVERAALRLFKEHSAQLREQRKTVAEEFDRRFADSKARTDAFRKSIGAAASPPAPEPTANAYHLAARVTGKAPGLGLPGVVVEMADPRDPKRTLAQAVTDEDGNAILTVPEELARDLDRRDTALTVLVPGGRTLVKIAAGVCIRVNQVETKVLTVKESADLEPLKQAALVFQAEREARLGAMTLQLRALRDERDERLKDLDCRLQDNEAIVADLERKEDLARVFTSDAPRPPPRPKADERQPQAQTQPPTAAAPPKARAKKKKPKK